MCLLFFPAHRSHALFLSCFSTRTHVHTHTHTHTQQTNRALTLSKLEDHEAVVAACTDALKLDPVNEKALFRRGVARSRLGFFDEAEADLNQVATNPEL
jgi:Flp pilus assembly protein TadD